MKRSGIQTTQSESLQIFISNLISKSNDPNSNYFRSSYQKFQQYIQSQYKKSLELNEETNFLNDLFVSISLSQLNYDTKHYLILLSTLIDIKLGNKIVKANRMAKDLGNIQSNIDIFTWKLLKQILYYLSKVLRKSIQLVLASIRQNIWKWMKNDNSTDIISAFYILSLFLKHFPSYHQPHFYHSQNVIINGLLNPKAEIFESALKALKSSLKCSEKFPQYNLDGFCLKLKSQINSKNFL